MDLNINLWYVKWFFWSCDIIDKFTRSSQGRQYKGLRKNNFEYRGTTLCQFIRTIGWGILITVAQAVCYAGLAYFVLIKPFLLFSAASILMPLGIALGFVCIVLAALFGAVYAIDALGNVISDYTSNRQPAKATDKPGFLKVMWEFIKAEKRKICPLISFTTDTSNSTIDTPVSNIVAISESVQISNSAVSTGETNETI